MQQKGRFTQPGRMVQSLKSHSLLKWTSCTTKQTLSTAMGTSPQEGMCRLHLIHNKKHHQQLKGYEHENVIW